ncbi:MAG: LysR family transcriptional regulator [Enterocloster asparagiformis]|nr:LysR family transcriptional regulator [Enterocloster asparagiformis]
MGNKLRYGLSIKLYGEDKAFGPGIAELLRNVEKEGSLQGAAQSMNMAYSKAWKILKSAEKEWGLALTDRETGGRDGGGSTLTPEAREILEHYETFMAEARQSTSEIFERHFSGEWIRKMQEQAGRRRMDTK